MTTPSFASGSVGALLSGAGLDLRDVVAVLAPIASADATTGKTSQEVLDLHTPAPANVSARDLVVLKDSDPRALEVIRHSTAHIMADAVQRLFPGTQVTFGPAIENGFYYDFSRSNGKQFTEEELEQIEKKMLEIAGGNTPFRREVVSRDAARELFTKMGEKFKLEHLERIEDPISLYRHGSGAEEWVDLCAGPHVPSSKFLRAIKLTHVSGAYWRGDERNPMLQRIYGTAFPSKEALDQHLASIEEAKKRDHRKLGKELELIAFHPWAPASPFFLPRGAHVYNALVAYIRDLYREFGYQEVITPQIFDSELFVTSGHLPNYAENMFMAASVENFEKAAEVLAKSGERDPAKISDILREHVRFGVKPMNCPGHALLFGMTQRSYRDLPLRLADFGRLHRFERSGVVQGLTRVRTFEQDDGHIFCTLGQIASEIGLFLDTLNRVYKDFGFGEVRLAVATRPEQRLGSDEIWDKAEAALIEGVRSRGLPFDMSPGEGAFYGPKLEFHQRDALGRSWQLGTMQADFNLPERFKLGYVGEDNTEHRPVMLHRAWLGSVERFFGVYLEHIGGAFPTWLAPDQVAILTVNDKFDPYAREVEALFKANGFRVVTDLSGDKLGAKIRNARMMRPPYLAIIGGKEAETRSVAVRSRDEDKDLGPMTLDAFMSRLRAENVPPSKRVQQA